jgi:uncharacterized protein (TIGR02646 family)
MIKVDRSDPPKYLTRYTQQWTDELLAAIQQHNQGGPKPSNTLWNKYNKSYVKNTLRGMFHDKCAYCESKVPHIAYPHIEHYRPKKKYPRHTFDWQNLLLACGICNGSAHKGDNFPLENGDENQPLLLNPCEDEPTQHLQFEQARIVPLTERGRVTRDLLGLNRDELFDRRRERLLFIDFCRRTLENDDPDGNQMMIEYAQELLELAKSEKSEYTAMVRQFMENPISEQLPL